MRFGYFILTVTVAGAAALSACTANYATRGNYLFEEDVQAIQPMVSTEYDVLNILGTPTTKAVFDDKTWYYVGLKTKQKSFFDPKVTEKQVYKVSFDENGLVSTIAEVTGESVDVPLVNRVTPTSGHNLTLMQQMLGNVGRFNTTTD